jgi:hypothetical protein
MEQCDHYDMIFSSGCYICRVCGLVISESEMIEAANYFNEYKKEIKGDLK